MIDRLPVVQQVGRVLRRPEEAPRSIRRRRDEMWNMMGNGEEDGGDQSSAIQTDKTVRGAVCGEETRWMSGGR